MVCVRKKSTSYNILVGKSEGKRPLTRPRHRREDNFKVKLKETEWVHLAQDWDQWQPLLNTEIILRVP